MLEFFTMTNSYLHLAKRGLDALFSLSIVVLLSPILLLVAVLVRLDSPGPILFVQRRLGWKGRIFNLYKFRTMTNTPRIPNREIVGKDPDLTRVGFWLRRFKLDEVPQLINIVIGDMSFIGPRPALPEQLTEYDSISRRRLDVRPGLSGLAQVSGNIHLSWKERWEYDVLYVDRVSFLMDMKILIRTFAVVILGEKRFLRKPLEKNHA